MTKYFKQKIQSLSATAILFATSQAFGVESAFTYQGQLKQGGTPLSGTVALNCSLWDDVAAGTQVGVTLSLPAVAIDHGLFTVSLDFGPGAFDGGRRWLEISVDATVLSPRQELTATPYAQFAGLPWVTDGTNISYVAGNVGIGTNSPAVSLDVVGPAKMDGFQLPTGAGIGKVLTSDGLGMGTWQAANATPLSLPYAGSANVPSPNAVFKLTNTTTTNGTTLWCETAGTNGIGVYSNATATSGFAYGGQFLSASPDGRAIFAVNSATTGAALGGRFGSASTSGAAVLATASAATGNGIGGIFESVSSTGGIGVYGHSTFFGNSGRTYGVYGQSDAAGAVGGVGVFGYSTAPFNTTYGVFGQTDSSSAAAMSVWAQGRFGASGTKAFRIDHPDDPENKYLFHYSAESPEVINFYSGKATLDAAGNAVIQLPRYFAKINKDPRYTLTAMGAAMPNLHIAAEIDEAALIAGASAGPSEAAPPCSFRIAGGAAGGKVSWRVEALRNDKWVQKHGAPVELPKESGEKGTYQHPELYNQPPERGMNNHVQRERSSPAELRDATNGTKISANIR